MADSDIFFELKLAFQSFIDATVVAINGINKLYEVYRRALGFAPIEKKQTPFERDLSKMHNDHISVMDRMNPENVS